MRVKRNTLRKHRGVDGEQYRPMGKGPGGVEARREYWRGEVEKWGRSGLRQKEYCGREGISLERFGYWRRRIEREREKGRTRGLIAVPSGVVSSALFARREMLGVVVKERYRVEIPDTFSPDTLARVLEVLGRM